MPAMQRLCPAESHALWSIRVSLFLHLILLPRFTSGSSHLWPPTSNPLSLTPGVCCPALQVKTTLWKSFVNGKTVPLTKKQGTTPWERFRAQMSRS